MIKEMLKYYEFETLEEYGKSRGFYNLKDAERAIKDEYEEDILWEN